MLVTEKEARDLRCPMSRDNTWGHNCVGSKCMGWHWKNLFRKGQSPISDEDLGDEFRLGQCGLTIFEQGVTHSYSLKDNKIGSR